MPVNVLLVEDNPADARLIRMALEGVESDDFILERAERLSRALERMSRGGVDAVLLDLSLPDSQGFDTFAKLHSHAPNVAVVVQIPPPPTPFWHITSRE